MVMAHRPRARSPSPEEVSGDRRAAFVSRSPCERQDSRPASAQEADAATRRPPGRVHQEEMAMTTTTESPTVDNGVNIEALRGARAALTDRAGGQPGSSGGRAAIGCTRTCRPAPADQQLSPASAPSAPTGRPTRSTPITRRSSPPRTTDRPHRGLVLSALATCWTTDVATVACNRGVQLHSVKATVTSDIRPAGHPRHRRRRPQRLRRGDRHLRLDADASRADLEAILAHCEKRSAVYDIITNPAAVRVALA